MQGLGGVASALMDLRPVTRIIMLLDAVPSSIPSLEDLPLNFARICGGE